MMSDTIIFSSVRSPCASGKKPATEEADVSPLGRPQSCYSLHFVFSAKVIPVGPLQLGMSCGSGIHPWEVWGLGRHEGAAHQLGSGFLVVLWGIL